MRTTSGLRKGSVFAIAVAAAAVSLAGCGGGGSSGTSGATNASSSGTTASADAFRDCLKEHGVDVPDNFGQGGQGGPGQGQRPANGQPPGGGEGGPPFGNDSKFQEAFNACRDKAPAGGFGGGQNAQAFQAYSSCLRDHGVNVPDPSTSTSTGQSTTPPTFDRNDPNFAAANATCQPLLPTPTSTTSSTVKS